MSGRAMMISNRKHAAMVAISATTSASTSRKPLCWRNRTSSTSSAVIAMPTGSGMPNNKFRAMAEPITSARSQAAMAISQITHSASETGRESRGSGGRPAASASATRVAMLLHGHFPAPQQQRELAPHHPRVARGNERDRRRAVEWLAVGHGEQHTGSESLLGEIAEARGILRAHLP